MANRITAAALAGAALLALAGCQPVVPVNAGLSPAEASALAAAIAAPSRTPANVARDRYRHPVETLAFFGVEPDDTVVEIWPGGGWYTEILAPYLASGGGRLILATPDGQIHRSVEFERVPQIEDLHVLRQIEAVLPKSVVGLLSSARGERVGLSFRELVDAGFIDGDTTGLEDGLDGILGGSLAGELNEGVSSEVLDHCCFFGCF